MPTHPLEQSIAGHRVLVVEQTASTNALALDLAARGGLRTGDAVLAVRQTAGRGRRGRRWVTVAGRSLALSVLVDPPDLARPAALSLLASVAVCRALERRGAGPLRIKWPNDIMRDDRKVGGLLIERAGGGPGVVVGVGINLALRPGDLPGDLAGRAGAVGLATDDEARHGHVRALLEELDRALGKAAARPDAGWRDEYRARSWLSGRRVDLAHGGRIETVRVREVTPDGDLVLDDGRQLVGEHVELRAVHGTKDTDGVR